MDAYWGEGYSEEKNITLAWVYTSAAPVRGVLKLACASCAQVFADGALIGFAPMRAAHGYARVSEYELPPFRTLVILAAGYNINSFWLPLSRPFCAAELLAAGRTSDLSAFSCVRADDRVQKVQRFSYQRCFLEDYVFDGRRAKLFAGDVSGYPPVRAVRVAPPAWLPSRTHLPVLARHAAARVREGGVRVDPSVPVWRDRAHLNVGRELLGFPVAEWEDAPTDEACRFVFGETGEARCTLFDLGRAVTGFPFAEVRAEEESTLYLLFGEIFKDGEEDFDFLRDGTANCIKFRLAAGEHRLLAFEPYAMRYLKTVCFGSIAVHACGIFEYENPDTGAFRFRVAERPYAAVLSAAVETFRQNAVDLLTDCPSRERAGWLSDAYFSSAAERLFTGKNLAEDAFLENYALSDKSGLPRGMLPMCYPADSYAGYIPNWAMWYILEVHKNARTGGSRRNAEAARENIYGIVAYFSEKENEEELLEDLDGWAFVEWSAANDPSHVCGVNFPSNMCWAKCLECVGELYGDAALAAKAERVRAAVRRFGFDGSFFVDNSVRGEDGVLHRTGLLTEVCQYYAFWFGVATPQAYPALYEEMRDRFGPARKAGYRPDVAPCNAIYGIYMRLDLFMREGDIRRLARECVSYFYEMAQKTGTLWEHNKPYASCVHGFASYAARWLVCALTGWDGERLRGEFLGTDCAFSLPQADGTLLLIEVKDGKRRVRHRRGVARVAAERV